MRNTSIVPSNVRAVNARITFRDIHLRFRKYPTTDGSTYTNGTWHDVCTYSTGILRVAVSKSSGTWYLFYQYTSDPNNFTNPLVDNWSSWTNSTIAVEPWSTVAVEGGRIFYQAANGNVSYVDFNGTNLGTPATLFASTYKPYAFGPVSTTELYIQYKATPSATFSKIMHVVVGQSPTYWTGRLYGSPDYLSGFDAARNDGRDQIFFTDENGLRTLYMECVNGIYSDVRQLIPLDVVDETSSFVIGGASIFDSKVFLSGVMKRDANFPLHIFTYEISNNHYTLGKEMFIRSGQTKEAVVTFDGDPFIFPMPAGKLVLVDDVLWYVYFGGAYYAYATELVGVDRASFRMRTSDFSKLNIGYASNQPSVLTIDLSTKLSGE